MWTIFLLEYMLELFKEVIFYTLRFVINVTVKESFLQITSY